MELETKALIFLLEEQVKKHPSSIAAAKAGDFLTSLKNRPEKEETYERPVRVPIVVNDNEPPRVPIAGSMEKVRNADTGELIGVTGVGNDADLVR